MKKKIYSLFTLVFASLMVLASCGNNDKTESSPSNDASNQTAVTSEDKEFDGRVLNVVATSDSYVPLFEEFTKETGADVEFLSMSSGEVLSRIKAEGKSVADLWFGGGLDAFMEAKDEGLLEAYSSDMTEKIPSDYKDEDGYYISKGLTVVGFLVNNDRLEEKGLDMPKSWEDLADPQYKDELIMSNPAISGTNYAALKGLLDLYGEDEGWDLFGKINENIPFYSKRGKDPQEKVSQGEFTVGIIPADKIAFDAAEDNNLTVVYPEDGISWVPEGVAIFKDSENTDIAKAFEDFMLTEKAQKMIAEIDGKDTNQLVVEGVEGYDLGLPKDKLIDEDLSTFGSQREEIINKFNDMAKDKASDK
ncbi:MAG: ABC transporter substrate-binding protein [Anaerococcus sp.]|nr:ABC transporter substrate-binding protein [Peptoniphilaceae bacterium]MDY3054534.1 ABC transporter substrate-binding protein [Anaerococcus sp.]